MKKWIKEILNGKEKQHPNKEKKQYPADSKRRPSSGRTYDRRSHDHGGFFGGYDGGGNSDGGGFGGDGGGAGGCD